MPLQHRLDTRRRLVVVEIVGDFTLAEILATVDAAVRDPEFEPGFDVLSDHRRIGEPITGQQVRSLTAHLEGLAPLLAGARWAVVTSKPASYGMMRMLSVLAEDVPIRVEVFRTMAEAEAWLGREPSA